MNATPWNTPATTSSAEDSANSVDCVNASSAVAYSTSPQIATTPLRRRSPIAESAISPSSEPQPTEAASTP